MSRGMTVEDWVSTDKAFRVDSTEVLTAQGIRLIEPGTEVVVYTNMGQLRGVVLAGPSEDFLFTGPAYEVEVGGRVYRYAHHIVVPAEDFDDALHLIAEGQIVAGGPGITADKLRSIAADYPESYIRRG